MTNRAACFCLSFCFAGTIMAQQRPLVPRVTSFSGMVKDAAGAPQTGIVGIAFSLYEEQQGGAPLWSEIQNVPLDDQGHYTVLLGSMRPEGLPLDLFATGKARWLGVAPQLPGSPEEPRVLLVGVPYALKAADAETLGGMPASAYMLAGSSAAAPPAQSATPAPATVAASALPSLTGTGTAGYISRFTSSSRLADSSIYQRSGGIGIGTTTPAAGLEVNGSAKVDSNLTLGGNILSASGLPVLQAPNTGSYNFSAGLGALAPSTTGTFNTAIGTNALQVNTTGYGNTAVGPLVLDHNTTGFSNTAVGNEALSSNTTGNFNTASGVDALESNTSGSANTASGDSALVANTTGSNNTASGASALFFNTSGGYNTASGFQALFANTTGSDNTANGAGSLELNTTGAFNTASGFQSLNANTTGTANTADGHNALEANTSGGYNTASGYYALNSNNTGGQNTASGAFALTFNSGGSYNTAGGFNALYSNTTGGNNTAFGYAALAAISTGSNNIALGANAATFATTGSNNIEIGNFGASTDSAVIRIGTQGSQTSAFIAGIYNANITGAAVLVNSSGQLGIASSSRRYKEDIQDMADSSSGLLRLRPVTFRYKKPYNDGSQPIQYGLIAEEVADVYPDLVARSADGQIETVKYQVLGPMLLNELQKQSSTIATQQEQIRDQGQQIRALEERLARLEAALDK